MYQVISNFNGGLDARKFFLSLPPGTLTQLINGHITPGGEIEKRKAFEYSALPAQVYGLQPTLAGIVVFGSRTLKLGQQYATTSREITGAGVVSLNLAADSGDPALPDFLAGDPIQVTGVGDSRYNGDWTVSGYSGATSKNLTYTIPTTTDEVLTADTGGTVMINVPSGLIYQQLVHPSGANLTGVVSSTYFDGNTFAVTTWDNGDTLVFYGTTLLTDFFVGGYCNLEQSAFAMASDFARALTATKQYTVTGPTLSNITVEITGGSAAGNGKLVGLGYSFGRLVTLNDSLNGGTFTDKTFTLINLPVAYAADNNSTAAAIAAAIHSNYYGFTASATGNVVTVMAPATDANGNSLGLNALDSLVAAVGGDLAVYIPPRNAGFDVFSIPTQSSPAPYVPSVTESEATLDFALVSNGVAATAPANAVGQFSITAGGGNPPARGTLTISGIPSNNDTVTIGGTTYTYVSALTNAVNEILISGSEDACLANLVAAINGSSGAGTTYSSGTGANTQASAAVVSGHATVITSTLGGAEGNIASTTTSGVLAWGSATLIGGGAAAFGRLTADAAPTNPANNDTFTIGGQTYRFRTSFTGAAAYDVVIGATADVTLTNLLLAVNGTGVAGTNFATSNYYSGTAANANVAGINQDTTNHALWFAAKATGAAGNAIALTKTITPAWTLSGATLSGGGADTNQITQILVGATQLLPAPVQFNQSVNQTASDVVAAINAYAGTSGFSATAQNNVVSLAATAGGAAVNEATLSVQCAGNVCIAACSFSVVPLATAGISQITATDSAGAHALLTNSSFTFQQAGYASETIGQYLARVAANINANTAVSGYLAFSNGAQMWLSRATVTSADVGPDPAQGIKITSTLVITTAATTALSLSTNAQSIAFEQGVATFGRANWQTSNEPSSAVVTVSGGVAPYTYAWSTLVPSPNAVPQLSGQRNQWWIFTPPAIVQSHGYPPIVTVPAHTELWICTVTDAAGTTVVSNPFYLQIPAYQTT